MPKINVTDRDGNQHNLEAPLGTPVMEVLRDEDMDVEGTCGGICSCGTCHCYVDAAWVDKLGPAEEDEAMMLEAIAEVVEVRGNSRLSCQIEMSDELDGLVVQVGPVA